MDDEKARKPFIKVLLEASVLGIHFVLCVIIGIALGYLIDNFIHTFPLFSIIFLMAGFAAGIREIFRFIKKAEKAEKTNGQSGSEENK